MILALHPLLHHLAPEIILCLGISLIILLGLSQSLRKSPWLSGAAMLTVALALLAAGRLRESPAQPGPELLADPLVGFTRLITLAVGFLILLVNRHVPDESERGEFHALILFSLAGIMLVSLANDLILLFLALELVSVPTYILVGLSRRDVRAQEATGKYFFLGAFAAALMLYGFSFLYGVAGTTTLFGAHDSLAAKLAEIGLSDRLVVLGLLLSLAGFAFKIAAVPFHFYVADVYQGAASPVTGLLGFVPKFAGFIALIRILSAAGWPHAVASSEGDALFYALWAIAAASMTIGNTLALMQAGNIKRILAYSSIAHSGYMLVALLAGPALLTSTSSPMRDGISALLFYMTIYGVTNLGVFAALSFFRKHGQDEDDSIETLDELRGAARRHPWAALALALCTLGLMGFPLTAGFLGKFYVFSAALSITGPHQTAMIVLVVIALLNSAIAAAYYLRIMAACFIGPPAEGVSASRCHALRLAIALCAALVVGAFFRPDWLFEPSRAAVAEIKPAPRQSLSPQTADLTRPTGTGLGSGSQYTKETPK